jgi:hypothetical protein
VNLLLSPPVHATMLQRFLDATPRCWLCQDTGFVPMKRAMLYTDRRKRPQDLRAFIIYLPCAQCNCLTNTRHSAG